MSGPRAQCPGKGRQLPQPGRGEAGFTLVEVGVALTVFMVGALAMALVMPLATRKIEFATAQTRASQLGAQRAERILLTPYDGDEITAGTHGDAANPRDGLYNVLWTVEDGQPIAGCKRATITVSRASGAATVLAQIVVVVPQAGVVSP
jgi:Tfp pilus assembly protein PilV